MSRTHVSVCVKSLFVAMVALGAAGCGGAEEGGLGSALSGGCKGTFPVSQQVSQGCCPEWGPDACGAGLFCAAFDGRAQPTCYLEGSRPDMAECTADVQCSSGSCNTEAHACRSREQLPCTEEVGCAPGSNGERIICATQQSSLKCIFTTGMLEARCVTSADCTPGLECWADTCRVPKGGSCNENLDCVGGSCSPFYFVCE